MATPKAKNAPKLDPLNQLAQDPRALLLQMLWQRRLEHPEMSIVITPKDREGLEQCAAFLKVGLEVRSFVRGQNVLVQAVDAKSKIVVRRRVAVRNKEGHDVIADKDFDLAPGEDPQPGDVLVSIGDAIRPIENNEADFDTAAKLERIRMARASAPSLVLQVKSAAAVGTFSKEMVEEVCNSLMLLVGQP